MKLVEERLRELYRVWCGSEPAGITRLPGSGSGRVYYRMEGVEKVIGAWNENVRENGAFLSFTRHFRRSGIPVPEILADDLEHHIYLLTDLGDTTLFRFLTDRRTDSPGTEKRLPDEVFRVYCKAINRLPEIQVVAGRSIDYGVCYPRDAFDRQSMMWDLNYFKYYFLKLTGIPFDEQALEDDFNRLCDRLLEPASGFFLFRDFQSRNIMVVDGEPWFIDYQGGRRGALHYDIASLLYDGKADLANADREKLLFHYLDALERVYPVNREQFIREYPGFVLIRILQALGAYGFRGYYEHKAHFLQSIPFALENLRQLREGERIGEGTPALAKIIDRMTGTAGDLFKQIVNVVNDNNRKDNTIHSIGNVPHRQQFLTVAVTSFSYKKGLPDDPSGHGGGFIFDCRALPNPGRYPEYSKVSGRDKPVSDFLGREPAVGDFLRNTMALVEQSVVEYQQRGFSHLAVSYGCTGGQHRSVYCAEQLSGFLKNKYKVTVTLQHRELI